LASQLCQQLSQSLAVALIFELAVLQFALDRKRSVWTVWTA
jgi:hypothetical protein